MRLLLRTRRAALAGIALVALFAACQMSVEVTTTVRPGGSGTLKMRFAFDKELIDVVGSTADGKKSLGQLKAIPGQFSQSGWVVQQSDAGGGLTIDVSRDFTSPADLNSAVALLHTSGGSPFPNIFKSLHLTHSSTFFTTTTNLTGSVDLSSSGLLPSGATKDKQTQALLEQAADKVFVFRVQAVLPGSVKSFTGDPEDVSGGRIKWSAKFGKTLDFSARASGLKPVVLFGGIGAVVVLAGGTVLVVFGRQRRRREATVPGWDVSGETNSEPAAPTRSLIDAAPEEDE